MYMGEIVHVCYRCGKQRLQVTLNLLTYFTPQNADQGILQHKINDMVYAVFLCMILYVIPQHVNQHSWHLGTMVSGLLLSLVYAAFIGSAIRGYELVSTCDFGVFYFDCSPCFYILSRL